jgi:hypothetical protein
MLIRKIGRRVALVLILAIAVVALAGVGSSLDKDGRQVLFQGVNRSGAEYACVQGGVCSPDRPPLARWARSPGGASSRARAPA